MNVSIVGVGMGNPKLLTAQATETLVQSDFLIGAARLLDLFAAANKSSFAAVSPGEIAARIAALPQDRRACVLVSGDVGFYSVAKRLREALSGHEVNCICGISSLQYFTAKLGTSWDDVKVVSLHGRNGTALGAVLAHEKTFLLTGGKIRVQDVCAQLCRNGFGDVTVSAGENLSYENERIVTDTAKALAEDCFESLAVMLVVNPKSFKAESVCGLPDEAFLRADVPMTKSEVRSVILSKLRPQPNDILYDIGAGTGSVSIELAGRATGGSVYAVECKAKALDIIERNKERFGARNLCVIAGKAPDVLKDLPAPDRVFIGGSLGSLREIIALLLKKNPAVRLVISAVTLETLAQAVECLREFSLTRVDIAQVSVAKARIMGEYHMMTAQNPVTIITAQGGG